MRPEGLPEGGDDGLIINRTEGGRAGAGRRGGGRGSIARCLMWW